MTDKFKTPQTGHNDTSDFDFVYEPAEDSFLMLDALEAEDGFLQNMCPSVCLEVGSGSGVCITFLSQILNVPAACFCTDINDRAASMTRQTGRLNNQPCVEPVLTHLVDAMSSRLANKVDVLLFNPPYVVTPSEEVGSKSIEASWAGGVRGREVLDRFLPQVRRLLAPKGVFYLVVIEENVPEEILQLMSQQGFHGEQIAKRRAGRELLSILKFTPLENHVT